MTSELRLVARPPFDFALTAYSHGWVVLAPNSWDEENHEVRRVERLPSGKVVRLRIRGDGSVRAPAIVIEVEAARRLPAKDCQEIERRIAHMFRLDEDFRTFYRECRKRGGRWKKVTKGLGRLLRSPTVFEDTVKVICTTNIQWGGTKKMVASLVDAFGEDGAFPTPEAIAAVPPKEFVSRVRMGYRAPYVHELASRVAEGGLDLEAFGDTELPTPELKKQLLALKGIGPYAAATLLMLLGRYDELAVDSVCRDFVGKKYCDGRSPTEKEVRAIYEDWDEWMFLAYWYDLWEGLHEKL